MKRFKEIETLFRDGFTLNTNGDAIGACDKWLEAWELIKELFTEGIAENIFDLNTKYDWTHLPSNYVQFLEIELHNAGIDNKEYHQKRVTFCQELLQWCGTNEETVNNTRIALGEAYFWSGDEASGEQLFKDWIRDDPDCGWAYSGWAGCNSFSSSDPQYEKAERILLNGFARDGLRDSIYVVESLINLYEETGETEKVTKFEKILSSLFPNVTGKRGPKISAPVRVVKIGRNEPCPCGSGKKYKKCCGMI